MYNPMIFPRSPLTGLRYRILFVFFSVSAIFSRAQTCDFISYGVEEGLSQSEAGCVLQDSRGYLWVGTAGGGVCSFDGIKFREYGKRDGLAGQIVHCIAEDSAGNLWFGTNAGISRYDGKTFTSFDRGPGRDEVNCLLAKNGSVWIGVAGGIYEYIIATDQMRVVSAIRDLSALCLDENGDAWAAAGNMLYHFNANRKDSVRIEGKGTILSIGTDNAGLFYIGCTDGLVLYRPSTNTFTANELTGILAGMRIRDVFCDHGGDMWIATMNRLVARFSPHGLITRYDESNGLSSETVYEITEDNTNHIWMATREQSLLKLRSESFTYYGNLPGMSSGTVFRIMEDHAGNIWVCSNQDGVYRYDGKTSQPVYNGPVKFGQPSCIVEDAAQKIWVGHGSGVTCLVNNRAVKTLLAGIRVRSLLSDSKGNLWIGTWAKGAYRYDGKTLTQFTAEENQLAGNFVHVLLEDHKGKIWFGTNNGLSCYDGTGFTSYGIGDGLCNTYVGSLAEDTLGNIWFHTDACIMRFQPSTKKITSYTDENGLASNTFYLLQFDKAGYLWVGTNKGLDRLTVDAGGRLVHVKNYSRNEGFRGIECNTRAVCLARDGCLWFGTVKGVIRYDPSKEKSDGILPSVQVKGIRLFLEPTDWTWNGVKENGWYHLPKHLELENNNNHLTFQYEAINLQDPAGTRYQFMLVGFDSTWQPVTSATEITYTNLPPGKYWFRVMGMSKEGKWNMVPAESGTIAILPPPPPFYQRGWFVVLAFLMAGGALYLIIEARTRRIKNQKAILESEVRERTLEISKQNEEKTLMLKEIHHRVKNNLQVISSLLNLQAEGIQDRRVLTLFEDCRHRVNSMALIHEKMYQSKNLVNIDIRNYIDDLVRSLIDAYDSNKKIRLHTGIEDHNYRIDSIVPMGLILNEIISNSLKYAFEDREEGDLFVYLRKISGNKFLLEVADNGRGIKGDLNLANAQSLGMQLIHMLSGQINGTVDLSRDNGTRYRIIFHEETKDRF
jgi:two-component sensor histidine kinase/ligand-binding sensor domain-containing protein